MGSIIIRPKAAIRQVLTEQTNRPYLSPHRLATVDAILAKEDASISKPEFAFLWKCGAQIQDELED